MSVRHFAAASVLLASAIFCNSAVLAQNKVLRVVPHSNLALLDPIKPHDFYWNIRKH